MKRTLLNWILTIAVAFILGGMFSACSGGNSSKNASAEEQAYLVQVSLAAEQFNQTLPKDEGVLELISYRFNPQQKILTLTHRFTTDDIAEPSPELINNVHAVMVEMMSHNDEEMDYIKHGITYQFDYFTVHGEFLFSTSITPEDFKDLNLND